MDARLRLTFFCGTCLGLAVGFAAGHVSLWQKFAPAPPAVTAYNEPVLGGHSASMGAGGYDLSPIVSEARPTNTMPAPGGAVVLNDPDLGDEPVHADALVEFPASKTNDIDANFNPRLQLTAPNPLPSAPALPLDEVPPPPVVASPPIPASDHENLAVSSEAPPVVTSESQLPQPVLDPEVVDMLKDELEGVSEQQREVWADALQGMNPADAAGIILMWKKFGQNTGGPNHLSSPPPLFRSSHPDAAPTPLNGIPNLKQVLPEHATDADLGSSISQHNQANRETCGYLEMIPILKEVPFTPLTRQEHVQVIGYRLDVEPGRHLETGNPSHVAVQRGCFFAVKLPTGEEQYTRVGRLVLDAERRLCIDMGDQDLPITPEVKLPEGVTRFMAQSGQLRVEIDGQTEPVMVGPLLVAEFFDASRLQPMGGSLYGATTASGKAKLVPAELILETLEYPSIEDQSRMAHRQ